MVSSGQRFEVSYPPGKYALFRHVNEEDMKFHVY
jgi:hypothetical protein